MRKPNFDVPIAQSPELQDYIAAYAVFQFNRFDRALLKVPTDEITICGRVAVYLQSWMWIQHKDYVVDMVYDNDLNAPDGGKLRLNLVVHKRDQSAANGENLFFIQMKKPSNRAGCRADTAYLQRMTDPSQEGRYHAGYLIYTYDKGETHRLYIKEVCRDGQPAQLIEPTI